MVDSLANQFRDADHVMASFYTGHVTPELMEVFLQVAQGSYKSWIKTSAPVKYAQQIVQFVLCFFFNAECLI